MNVVDEAKTSMEKTLTHLRDELASLRTNRPNPSMLDGVVVEAYGTEMRLKELGSVSVVENRQLVVTPFDPQVAAAIKKGIEKAELNLQPFVDGHLVRVPFPPMNEELRKEIAKEAKKKNEETKVTIRDVRRRGNERIKKEKSSGEISEDMQKGLEKKIQTLTDEYCKKADEMCAKKEKEILTV